MSEPLIESGRHDYLRLGNVEEVAQQIYALGESCIELSDVVVWWEHDREIALALLMTRYTIYFLREGPRGFTMHALVPIRDVFRVTWDPDGLTFTIDERDVDAPIRMIRCSEGGRRYHLHLRLRKCYEEETFCPLPSVVARCDAGRAEARRAVFRALRQAAAAARLQPNQAAALASLASESCTLPPDSELAYLQNLLAQLSAGDASMLPPGSGSPIGKSPPAAYAFMPQHLLHQPSSSPARSTTGGSAAAVSASPSPDTGGVTGGEKEGSMLHLEQVSRELDEARLRKYEELEALSQRLVGLKREVSAVRSERDGVRKAVETRDRRHLRSERAHVETAEAQGRTLVACDEAGEMASIELCGTRLLSRHFVTQRDARVNRLRAELRARSNPGFSPFRPNSGAGARFHSSPVSQSVPTAAVLPRVRPGRRTRVVQETVSVSDLLAASHTDVMASAELEVYRQRTVLERHRSVSPPSGTIASTLRALKSNADPGHKPYGRRGSPLPPSPSADAQRRKAEEKLRHWRAKLLEHTAGV
ncbi:hypothetical protein DIPPA_30083 [Diplonema papillatum]|nr:hypothetical protein DIPPA_30083 [Diplonema papillatum]